MADINTVLRRAKVDAPNTRNQQQVLAYVPLANGDTPGIVKPDGKQFYVDADGTLHVNAEYVRRINDISFKYDTDGNTVVTVIFNDETTDEFLVKKGDTGLPYIISTSLIGMNTSVTTEHNFKRMALSRTPVVGDIIFSRFYDDADDYTYVYLGLFLVNSISYESDGRELVHTTLVSKSRITGPKGDKGEPGMDGVGITSISKVITSPDGNVYKITLSDGSGYEFTAPFGPQGIPGPKGDKGDRFSIDKVYSSVDEMNSGFSTDSVPQGGFVLIDTGNVEDPDNAKLYVKGELSYRYVTDLSGSEGIQGPKGDPGSTVQVMLGMDGVVESGRVVFTVADADSYVGHRENLQEFIVSMHLPVTGTLDASLEVVITFGDTTYYLYTLSESSSVHLTIGDLMSVSSYNETSGYYFNTRMVFLSNSEFVGFSLVPPSITAKQTSKIFANSDDVEYSVDGMKLKSTLSEQVKAGLVKEVEAPLPTPTATSPYIVYSDNKAYVRQVKAGNVIYVPGEDFKYYYIVKYQQAKNTWNYRILWTKKPVTEATGTVSRGFVSIQGNEYTTYSKSASIVIPDSFLYSSTYSTLDSAIAALKSSDTTYTEGSSSLTYLSVSEKEVDYISGLTSPILKSNATNDFTYITYLKYGSSYQTAVAAANANGSVSGAMSTVKDEYIELTRKDELTEVVQATGTSTTAVMSQKAVTDAISTAITTTLNTAV